jgi:small subunit ribosomal protein S16
MRIGTKQRPFYRVVAVDERSKRNGEYIELLGTYNPLTEPKEIKLKQDRIDHWIKQGAQLSDGFLRIIGKAKQRKPRKPKKASKQGTVDSGQPNAQIAQKPEEKVEVKNDETVQKELEQNDSEKPENPVISESENVAEKVSETSETPTQSDSTSAPTPSESPETVKEETNERLA